MKVREIMTTAVRCAEPDTSLDNIARMMRDEDVGAIPVLDGEDLAGIVTDRDIVLRCVAARDDPLQVTAEDIMAGPVRAIAPDANVEDASRLMAEAQLRRLPVCEDGRLVGIISIGDIAVKQPNLGLAGDALESISEGVKVTRPGHRETAPRAEPAQALPVPESTGAQTGGQQQTLDEAAGRHGSAPSIATGHAPSQDAANAEPQRQSNVVPIRTEEKAVKTAQRETKQASKRRAPEPPAVPKAKRAASQQPRASKRRAG